MLGNFDATIQAGTGLGQDRLIGRATTSTHRSASTMENAQGNPKIIGRGLESLLSLMNFPVAAQKARVFVAVRVAQHDLLNRLRWWAIGKGVRCL